MFKRIPGILVSGLLICACRGSSRSTETNIVVFAAASLTDAFDELADTFESDHPGVTVFRNYGSSSQLAIQLVEGAPADVYASANTRQMGVAQEAGRIAGEPVTFASNRLVVILPIDNPAGIDDLGDLANPGLRLVLAVPSTPVRDYTDQMIEAMAASAAYGPAFREAVYANLVSEEDTVRRVVTKVTLGEADAGIVYTSDVTPDVIASVRQIAVPDPYNVRATYPIGLIADAPHPELAQVFIDFVLSEEGQAILARWGFGPTIPG